MTRLRERIREKLLLPGGLLMLGALILWDGSRLHASKLWGTADWLLAALAGMAVATVGLIMAAVSSDRRRRGEPWRAVGSVLALAYTFGMTLVLSLTHNKHDPQPRVDSPFMVAALTAEVVLAVGLPALFVIRVRNRTTADTIVKRHR